MEAQDKELARMLQERVRLIIWLQLSSSGVTFFDIFV